MTSLMSLKRLRGERISDGRHSPGFVVHSDAFDADKKEWNR